MIQIETVTLRDGSLVDVIRNIAAVQQWTADALAREAALRGEVETLTKDKERLDWLEVHPLKSAIHGGSDDGATGTFWGCGSANCTLRETIDTISAMP